MRRERNHKEFAKREREYLAQQNEQSCASPSIPLMILRREHDGCLCVGAAVSESALLPVRDTAALTTTSADSSDATMKIDGEENTERQ